MSAQRIQRQRTKGWRMPEGAVYVGRPSLWGNPWAIEDGVAFDIAPAKRAEWAVRMYRRELEHWGLLSDFAFLVGERRHDAVYRHAMDSGAANMAEYARVVLGGRDLACWCPLDQPCHADVLLDLANREDAA